MNRLLCRLDEGYWFKRPARKPHQYPKPPTKLKPNDTQ